MNSNDWFSSKKNIEKSNKQYAHFDLRTNIANLKDYLTDPQKISRHSFYPLIHYDIRMRKYNQENGRKDKVRSVSYASHIDCCIYQYYSFILNELYNERVKKDGINDVPVAYRTDLHKNNAHFAKRAIDYIKHHSPCTVMIGDFTTFFDRLDHKYLKSQWCSLLKTTELLEDHYAVYKSITKFNTWDMEDLLKLNGLENNNSGRRELNSKVRVLTKKEYRENRSHIHKNTNSYGIPQGTPISATLANVYMLEVDNKINEMVTPLNGLYMRYSDDFIVVVPTNNEYPNQTILDEICFLLNGTDGLSLQPEKTQIYTAHNAEIWRYAIPLCQETEPQKSFISFLGFTFDGQRVDIRGKTSSKYYYRMRRKARTIAKSGGISPTGKHISNRNLYDKYSIRGAFRGKGNFFTYVENARKVFEESSTIGSATKRHMQKIREEISKKN